jgi:hypothetical protein
MVRELPEKRLREMLQIVRKLPEERMATDGEGTT